MSEPQPPIGFWSYTRSDDMNSGGRLSQSRVLLARELQLAIGQRPKVRIWQDVATLNHGTEWETEIQRALGQSSFLIPIVSPAFLQSQMCCQEVRHFMVREKQLGRADLIFPFCYIDIGDINPDREEECQDKEVLALPRRRHNFEFVDLRHSDPNTEEVSQRVARLAGSIRMALRRESFHRPPVGAKPHSGVSGSEENAEGLPPVPQIDRDSQSLSNIIPETEFASRSDTGARRRLIVTWRVLNCALVALGLGGFIIAMKIYLDHFYPNEPIILSFFIFGSATCLVHVKNKNFGERCRTLFILALFWLFSGVTVALTLWDLRLNRDFGNVLMTLVFTVPLPLLSAIIALNVKRRHMTAATKRGV